MYQIFEEVFSGFADFFRIRIISLDIQPAWIGKVAVVKIKKVEHSGQRMLILFRHPGKRESDLSLV